MPDDYSIHITRSSRRTLALSVDPDGSIFVKAPYFTPKFFINQFIEKNREWIEKRLHHHKTHMALPKNYTHGEKFLFLGNEYTLEIGPYTEITLKNDKLLFPQATLFRAKKELENWYIRQAKEIIIRQTEDFAMKMHTSYASITFSDTKSQWGRCTHDNRLQFNWKLVMTPLLVLNYVVVHELAHTVEKNHSITFWRVVRSVMPSYKQQIKWLKQNGNTLVV